MKKKLGWDKGIKLLFLLSFMLVGNVLFGQDVLQQFYYADEMNFANPLLLPDGVTPIPDGCLIEIVITATEDVYDYYADPHGEMLNNNFGVDYMNGDFLGVGPGFFMTNMYLIWEDPPGSPPEPVANCGDQIYLRIYDAPSIEEATQYMTSEFIIGPEPGSQTSELEVTVWNPWEEKPEDLDPPTNLHATVDDNDVHLTWNEPGTGGGEEWFDDFESYQDFTLTFEPWTLIDLDQSETYGHTAADWENEYAPMAYMIFNPTATTPPLEDAAAFSGDKMAACFASTTPPNNDWMITPQINIGNGFNVSFWAKSYTADYGLERFKVGVSTTDTDPASFSFISAEPYEEAPADEWTQFTFDLSEYAGQDVFIGINCVSNDAFILFIDDFYVGAGEANRIAKKVSAKNSVTSFARETGICTNPEKVVYNYKRITNENSLNRDLLGYNVYRDGVQINTEVVAETEYDDFDLAPGYYSYTVAAVYDAGQSPQTDPVEAHILGWGSITGTVTDGVSGEIIEGAEIVAGSFTDVSGPDGTYHLDVIEGNYDVTCSYGAYIPQTVNVDVANEEEVVVDFALFEEVDPPHGVEAIEQPDGESVELTWHVPGTVEETNYVLDDGSYENGWAINPGYEAWLGNLFPVEDSGTLIGFSVYAETNSGNTENVTIDVFDADHNLVGTSDPFILPENEWVTIAAPDISFNGEFYAMVHWNMNSSSTNWLGFDENGPNANSNLDWYYSGSDWELIHNLAGSPGVFMIRATALVRGETKEFVLNGKKDYQPIRMTKKMMTRSRNSLSESQLSGIIDNPTNVHFSNITSRNLRDIENYQVYRLLDGEQEIPENWVLLSDAVTDTFYTDNDWADLDPGIYLWAVKAVYTGNNVSDAAFSNILAHEMTVQVTVNVTTNSGDDPEGASVVLTNIDGDPDHIYEMSAPSGGVTVFPEVWMGTYVLEVSLPGFTSYSQEGIDIDDDLTLNAELEELLLPPTNLEVTHEGQNVTLTWGEPGTGLGFVEDFEDGVLPEGWTMITNSAQGWFITQEGSSDWFTIPPHTWYACSNDDMANDDGSMDYLITPPQDLSVVPEISISFQSFFNGAYSQTAYLEVSEDGGNTWEVVQEMTPVDDVWTEVTVDLSDYCGPGHDEVLIGFHADDNGAWASGWAVDDIILGDGGANRELLGYNVYRNEDPTPLNDTPITETTYNDPNAPIGTYRYDVTAVYTTGESSSAYWTGDVEAGENDIPAKTALGFNAPNPIISQTKINFSLHKKSKVSLDIYNTKGQKVKTLVSSEMEPGNYSVIWSGTDNNNKKVASGIYFYKMKAGKYTSTKKMILMK